MLSIVKPILVTSNSNVRITIYSQQIVRYFKYGNSAADSAKRLLFTKLTIFHVSDSVLSLIHLDSMSQLSYCVVAAVLVGNKTVIS